MAEKGGDDGVVVEVSDLVAEKEANQDEQVALTAEDNKVIDAVVGTLGPLAMRFGFGGFVGFCSGYAMKKSDKGSCGLSWSRLCVLAESSVLWLY
mmetsp:Transcript_37106/g.60466  ORF Transcript_37106/g.60466 Transcript_37106/m.60466 type:complete len:95 (+) Transcript_37106:124-408(+)